MGASFEKPEKACSGSITPVTSRTTTAPSTAKVGEMRSVTSVAMVSATTTSVSQASQVTFGHHSLVSTGPPRRGLSSAGKGPKDPRALAAPMTSSARTEGTPLGGAGEGQTEGENRGTQDVGPDREWSGGRRGGRAPTFPN